MLIDILKDLVRSNPYGLELLERYKRIKYQKYVSQYSDEVFVKMQYRQKTGREFNLQNPRLLTEKLQWLKLYYRDPTIPVCSDKIEVKKYIAEKGFLELAVPTLAIYDRAEDVDVSHLPDNFILKASHGSGWNILCRGNKDNINWRRMKKIMNIWLKENLYIFGREWNYKDLTPRILAEELISDAPVVDYKFMCFNGTVKAMQVNHEVSGKKYLDFYDSDWRIISGTSSGTWPNSGEQLPKPLEFERMKEIAEELAKPFPFVRVDLYNVDGKIYLGEMTFFPASGNWNITPIEKDMEFGNWLTLPSKQ